MTDLLLIAVYIFVSRVLMSFSVDETLLPSVIFWPFDPAKNAIQSDAPEGSDTF